MDIETYQREAQNTKSNQFNIDRHIDEEIMAILQDVEQSGEFADQLEKSLFYGKPINEQMFNLLVQNSPRIAPGELTEVSVDQVHAILGFISEAAEFAELLREAAQSGKSINRDDLIDEAGDLMWYLAMLLQDIGSSFDEVTTKNNAKLRTRFPHKFTADAANVRDLEAERNALVNA